MSGWNDPGADPADAWTVTTPPPITIHYDRLIWRLRTGTRIREQSGRIFAVTVNGHLIHAGTGTWCAIADLELPVEVLP
ncbi:hypothetical protein [Rhodococcus aetherivorans]|uniref:hypothetical protein n=1 Tax=Rhodococcus aetherivorans TaxID=191292 RepID=UPI00045D1092|nr:hypothetical protein [Rhodococcus aetherivorans]KDE14224.1 hypothetical protein N505_0105210 [Rhodococcus aetherivorans]